MKTYSLPLCRKFHSTLSVILRLSAQRPLTSVAVLELCFPHVCICSSCSALHFPFTCKQPWEWSCCWRIEVQVNKTCTWISWFQLGLCKQKTCRPCLQFFFHDIVWFDIVSFLFYFITVRQTSFTKYALCLGPQIALCGQREWTCLVQVALSFFRWKLSTIWIHWIKYFQALIVFLSDRFLQETYGSLFLMLLWKQLTWSRYIDLRCFSVVWLWNKVMGLSLIP